MVKENKATRGPAPPATRKGGPGVKDDGEGLILEAAMFRRQDD